MDNVLVQRQGQVLSTQMIQSVEILQMSTQELVEYLETTIQENPVLELQEHHDVPEEPKDLRRKLEWLESMDPQNRSYYRQDYEQDTDFLYKYGTVDDRSENLHEYILAQIQALELPLAVAACARLIADSLNQNGWLDESILQLAQDFGRTEEMMERGLAVVQSLDPPGVAARNLSECLNLQLMRRVPRDMLALQIVGEHLEALSRNHYRLIAQTLKVEERDVRRSCDLIRSLDPRPGARFTVHEHPSYITPDIIIAKTPNGFELLANEHILPSLHISNYYIRLLRESDDAQVKDYLTEKMGQAKWVIQAVEQRHKTLMACATCIFELQENFFKRNGYLMPLTLADVAEQIGVHPSTVSRAINGKYLQCARGVYPLGHFFSHRLNHIPGDGEASSDAAKACLKKLIDQEDKRKPLSDQKLSDHMVACGFTIARRTVAKYREELGIPGATGRKTIDMG